MSFSVSHIIIISTHMLGLHVTPGEVNVTLKSVLFCCTFERRVTIECEWSNLHINCWKKYTAKNSYKMPPDIVLCYHQVHGSMKNCKYSMYLWIKSDQIVLTLDLQVIDLHSVEISWASWDVSTPSKFEAKPGNKTAIATDFDHVLIHLHYNSIAVFTIF